jgi:hypothetical protein
MNAVAGLVALFGGACSPAGDAARVHVQRSDSAGVAVVESSGPDVPLEWTLEPRVTIGDDESGDAAFAALHPAFVAVSDSGKIIVLDGQNHRLIVFVADGRHLRTFGKQGGGPGELEFPNGLAVDRDGNAVVFDFSKRELMRFSLDGAVLPGIPRPEERPFDDMAVTAAGTVFSWNESSRSEGGFESIYLMRDTTPEPIARYARPPTPMVMYESCRIGMAIGPLFAPRLTWDARGDRVIAAGGADYVIDVFEGARKVGSFRRTVEPVPTTTEMATRELDGGMKVRWSSGECTVAPEEVIEKRGMASALPALSRVALAPDGTIWAARGLVKGDTAAVDVFSRTGEYLGTLPRGAPMPAAFFPNGDILAIELDALDVPRLVVYRVDATD